MKNKTRNKKQRSRRQNKKSLWSAFKEWFFVLSFFVAFIIPVSSVFALPQIDSVVSGSVDFVNVDATTLNITATDKAIVNYSSFNIAEGETVNITLPSSTAEFLNRVTGGTQSNILGNLTCNGIMLLVNEAGIYFGANSHIDVQGLIASTRDITNSDFLSGNHVFSRLSKEQLDTLLVNKGTINIREGGFGVFIAGAVDNSGTIIAPLGTIAIAGAEMVTLNIAGEGLISVAINKEQAESVFDTHGAVVAKQVNNTGTISAPGGTVLLKAEALPDIFEMAINLEGYVRADSYNGSNGLVKVETTGKVNITGTVEATTIKIGSKEILPEAVEAVQGSLIAASGLEVAARSLSITSTAPLTYIYQPDNMLLTSSILDNETNLITLTGEGINVTYSRANDLTLETSGTLNTTVGLIIQANSVKLIAQKFGTSTIPVQINANNTYIQRLSGNIDILESVGLGTTILLRGPPEGSFGQIIYNKDTNLTLEAKNGSITVYPNSTVEAKNLTLKANNAIYSTGSLIAYSELNLIANGAISSLGYLNTAILIERGASFLVGGTSIVGYASMINDDNAVTYNTGDYSGPYYDAGNIIINDNAVITLIGDTTFWADYNDPSDSIGGFIMNPGSSIVGSFSLTLYASSASTLRTINIYGSLTIYESDTGSNPTYTANNTIAVGDNAYEDYLTLISGILDLGSNDLTAANVLVNGGTLRGGSGTMYIGGGGIGGLEIRSGSFIASHTVDMWDTWGYIGHSGGTADWLTNQSTLYASVWYPTIQADTYYNLTLNSADWSTYTLAGHTTINNTLTFNNECGYIEFYIGTQTLTLLKDMVIPSMTAVIIAEDARDSGGGIINIGGNWANNGTFTAGSGTVVFNGSGNQTISGSSTHSFFKWTINKSGGEVILGGNVTMTGDGADWIVVFNTATPVNLQTYTLTFTGASDAAIWLASEGWLTTPAVFFKSTNSNGKIIFLADTGIVDEAATNTYVLGNIQIGDATHSPNVFIFDMGEGNSVFAFNDVYIANVGATFDAWSFPITVSGNWINNGTFTSGSGTVTFTGSSASISGTQSTYFYNLTINSPGSVTLTTGALYFTDTLEVTGSFIISGSTAIYTRSNDTTPIIIINNASSISGDGLFYFAQATNPTITLNGSGAFATKDVIFQQLAFGGAASCVIPAIAYGGNGTFMVLGQGGMSGIATFTLGTGTFSTNGDLKIISTNYTGGVTVNLVNSNNTNMNIKGSWSSEGSGTEIYTHGTETVTFNGASGTQTIDSTAGAFYNVTISNTGTKVILGSNTAINGTLMVSLGNLDMSTYNLNTGHVTINGGTLTGGSGSLVLGHDVCGTLTISSGNFIAPAVVYALSYNKTGGTIDFVTNQSTFTIHIASGAGQTIYISGTYYNLVLDSGGDSYELTGATTVEGYLIVTGYMTSLSIFGFSLEVYGDIFLDVDTSLSATTGTITCGGSWDSEYAFFNPGSSTVTFNATSGGRTIIVGSENLFNLIISGGTGTIFSIESNISVANNFTLNSGTVDQAGNISIGGNYSQTGGVFACSTPTTYSFNVTGSFSIPVNAASFNRFSGSGTSGSPYIVRDVYDLQAVQCYSTAYFLQNNNINASITSIWNSNLGFVAIGNESRIFSGSFNGNNYTITGLYQNRPNTGYGGLFAWNTGTIQNVGLINNTIIGRDSVGGLASWNSGTISNCYETGNVTGHVGVGGITGGNSGSGNISNSYATGNVTGSGSWVGGFVGSNGATITNCYATGTVTSAYDNVGGFAGDNGGPITNCYATGNVIGGNLNIGGFTGWNGGTLLRIFATGDVIGNECVGGLVGSNGAGYSITNSYATGSVTGLTINAGGLVGWNGGQITNSYSIGAVTGVAMAGGLVGSNSGTVTSSYWDVYASGTWVSAAGTGKETYQMKGPATFVGWTFNSTNWQIDAQESYPYQYYQIWTWTGAGDGISWANANNWSNNIFTGYPNNPAHKAVINSSSAGISTPAANTLLLGSLTLGSNFSGILTLGNDLTTAGSVLGNIKVTSGTLNMSTYDLTAGNRLTINGGSLLGGTGTITVSSWGHEEGGLFINNASSYFKASNLVIIGWHGYDHTAGTTDWLTNNSTLYYYISASTPLLPNETLDIFKNVTIDANGGEGMALSEGTIRINGNLLLTQGAGIYAFGETTLIIAGNFTIDLGSYFYPGSSTIQIGGNWNNYEYFEADTSTVIFNGTGTQYITSSGNNFFNLTINKTSGSVNLLDALTVTGEFKLQSGFILANAKTVTVTGLATISGGTYFTSSQKQTFNGGLTLSGGTLGCSLGEVEVNGTLTISGGTLTGSTGILDINGDLIFTNGTLTAPSGTFTISGSWNKSGGTFNCGTYTVTFDGNSSGKTISTNSGNFHNLTIAGGASGYWTLSSSIMVVNMLTVSSGTLAVTAAGVDITAENANILGGTLNMSASSSNMFIALDLIINGGSLLGGTGTLTISCAGNGRLIIRSGLFRAFRTVDISDATGYTEHSGGTADWLTNSSTLTISPTAPGGSIVPNDEYYNLVIGNGFEEMALNCSLIHNDLTITYGTVWAPYYLEVLGNITINSDSTLYIYEGASIYCGGNMVLDGGYLYGTYGSYVNVGGNLTLNNSALIGMEMAGLYVAGNTAINDSTIWAGGNAGYFNCRGDVLINTGGTLSLIESFAYVGGDWTNYGTYLAEPGWLTFNGSTEQTIITGGTGYGKYFGFLTIANNSAEVILSTNALLVDTGHSCTLTINAGAVLNLNGQGLTAYALYNNGILKLQGSEAVSFTYMDYDSGTVEYTGTAGPYTIRDFGTNDYNNLIINGSGAEFNLGNGLKLTRNLTISAGTLNAANQTITIGGNWVNTGIFTCGTSTVIFNSAGTQTLDSGGSSAQKAFFNLTHSGTGTLRLINSDINIDGSFINASGTFDGNSLNINVAGSWTNNSIFIQGWGTLTFDGNGTGNTISESNNSSSQYFGIYFNSASGTGKWTLATDFGLIDEKGQGEYFIQNMTVHSGIFDMANYLLCVVNLTINGGTFIGGSNSLLLSQAGGGYLYIGSGNFIAPAIVDMSDSEAFYLYAPAVTDWLTNNSTFYVNTYFTPLLPADTYYNLVICGISTLSGTTTVRGNLDIQGELSLMNRALNVWGDFNNLNSFNADYGTVTFLGSATSTISGNNTFYRLTCTTAGKVLQFTAGSTTTVTNLLTITGTSGNRITLKSVVDGSVWNLNTTGATVNVSHANIQDSSSTIAITPVLSHDLGNNTNWNLVSYLAITSSAGSISAGTPLIITITAFDQIGEVALSYRGTNSLVFSGLGSITGYNPTINNIALGTATPLDFSNGTVNATLIAYKPETATLDTTDSTYTSTGHGLLLNVGTAAAHSLEWIIQPKQTADAGIIWQVFSLRVLDVYGNVYTVPVAITLSSNIGSLSGTTVLMTNNGTAQFNNIAYNLAQAITLTASSGNCITATAKVTVSTIKTEEATQESNTTTPNTNTIANNLLTTLDNFNFSSNVSLASGDSLVSLVENNPSQQAASSSSYNKARLKFGNNIIRKTTAGRIFITEDITEEEKDAVTAGPG